jgi:hypothetical protein
MNSPEEKLKKEVLSRVRSIYYMRTVVRPFVVELGLFVVSAVAISLLISVPSVIMNMVHSEAVGNYLSYLFSAFVHTKAIVQLTLVASIILMGLLAKEAFGNLKKYSPKHFLWGRAV